MSKGSPAFELNLSGEIERQRSPSPANDVGVHIAGKPKCFTLGEGSLLRAQTL